ncbi:MAG: PIG-L family deacetylase [Acidobacteriia bacterium]|nr:PIG-L family deacetylase [Terriglobia bacterium]
MNRSAVTTPTHWLFSRIFHPRTTNFRRWTPRAAVCTLLALGLIPIRGQRSLTGEIEIRQALERLNTLGSVMMIGAHPDDEREQVLAYLALGRHVRTAYLSLTRGEGGQNLIGPEQGDELGIIRSQELLASRRIDGAEQYFTRAIDFGFSKTADETLQKWDRNKVLGDVVYNIRRFRPDVVILVFSGTPRDGHGHHQASSILGKEAFSLAGDPTKFPEQLAYVQPWTPKLLMMNAGFPGGAQNKGKGGKNKADDTPPADRLNIDVGVYSPELGASFGEIGGASRSANRTQGTGSAEAKGSQLAPMETVIGDKARKDLFENLDITWNRLPGGAAVTQVVQQALDSFAPAHPEALLPALIKARPLIAAIKDPLAERKLKEVDDLIALCAGLSLEAQADKASVSPGATLKVNFTAIQRLPGQVALTGIRLTGMEGAPTVNLAPTVLVNNQPSRYNASFTVPQNQPYTQPSWLEQPKDGALYSVRDPRNVGLAEDAPVLEAHFRLQVAGADLELTRPVQYRYVDRVFGEQVRPFTILPPVAVSLPEHALVFGDAKPRRIEVAVRSNGGKVAGDLRLDVPTGWTADPASRHFELAATEEQTNVFFNLVPPAGDSRGKIRAVAQVGTQTVSTGTEVIQYPHITTQTLLPPAEATLVRADIRILSKTVGYVMGAGDDVPQAIRQLGCEVTLLTEADLAHGDLARFDAIVTGVRAFNTRPDLRANYQRLFDYANNGGTLIVQYNVPEGGAPGGPGAGGPGAPGQAPAGQAPPPAAPAPAVAAAGDGGLLAHIGPYPIRITRNDRVTLEEAPVAFPNPDLHLLHAPNQISSADFDGWVQERGLYFADEWDPKYKSVLESHDPGEMPLPGGMLYAPLGKGAYIFSAYDWFRELPAGVPGAYRMFANMLSAAKTQ